MGLIVFCVRLFIAPIMAIGIGLPKDMPAYQWTAVESSYLDLMPGDYLAKFVQFSTNNDLPIPGSEVLYVIYRTKAEKDLLERYMKSYPNAESTMAILGFAVYLGRPSYQDDNILGKGTEYEAPLSVTFRPYVEAGIADYTPEVCDGTPSQYNFHGSKNDTTISVGINFVNGKYVSPESGEIAPAPQYCPWSFFLGSVTQDNKEIWSWDSGMIQR